MRLGRSYFESWILVALATMVWGLFAGVAHAQVPESYTPEATPPPAGHDPHAAVEECIPTCRRGFVCAAGRCVSACNPPCGDGEVCTAAGECQMLAPQPAQPAPHSVPGATSGTAPPQQPAPAVASGAAEPAAVVEGGEEESWSREGWAWVGRLGLLVLGDGEADCNTTAPGESRCIGPGRRIDDDYDEASPVLLAFEGLRHLTRGVRLGFGVWTLPRAAVEVDGDDYRVGWETSLLGIFEGLIQVGRPSAIVLRAHAGLALLFPGGDLADLIDEAKDICRGTEMRCRVSEGPFTGFVYGAGIGFVSGSDEVRWRIDVISQLYSTRLFNSEFSLGEASIREKGTVTGVRGWLTGGVEF